MTDFDIQVRLYEPGLAATGVLDTLTIAATMPVMSLGVLNCSISRALVPELPSVIEAALEYWDAVAEEWIEPRDARFIIRGLGKDERDPSRANSLAGVSLFDWLARKAIVKPGEGELLASGHRPFNSSTGGAIVATLFDEAQTRGWAPYLSRDFSATLDSNGVAWAEQITIAYEPGRTTLLMVVDNLVAQGLVERRTEGRVLRLFNPESGAHLDEGAAPVKLGAQASQMPVERSIDDLVTDLTFYGEDGFTLELANSGAYAGLGRLETSIVQGGVNDSGTATLLGQTALTQGKQAREQISSTESAALAEFLPWRDYNGGDWIIGIRDDGTEDSLRVQEIVVRKVIDGEVSVSATLNDRFEDLLARLAKRTAGILGGAVAGGSGSVPADGDTRKPKPPTGLIVSPSGYYDADGASRSAASLDWADVDQGENDVAIDVQGYEVWARPDDGATPSRLVVTSTISEAVSAVDPSGAPYEPGSSWIYKVRAQSGNGVWGDFGAESAAYEMLDADPALEKPLPPIVTSAGRVVLVSTNGLFDTDPPTTAPSWFREFRIERSANIASEYVGIGALNRDVDARAFNDMAVGDGWYFRLVPVDRLGRDGTPSDPTFIEVVGVDGADIIARTITAENIEVGTLTADLVTSEFGAQIELGDNVRIIALDDDIAAVGTSVGVVAGDVADVAADVATMGTYFDFAPDGLGISAPGSDYSQRISATRTEFLQGAQVISYLEAGQFVAPLLVAPSAKIGNHQWSKAAANAGSVVRALL